MKGIPPQKWQNTSDYFSLHFEQTKKQKTNSQETQGKARPPDPECIPPIPSKILSLMLSLYLSPTAKKKRHVHFFWTHIAFVTHCNEWELRYWQVAVPVKLWRIPVDVYKSCKDHSCYCLAFLCQFSLGRFHFLSCWTQKLGYFFQKPIGKVVFHVPVQPKFGPNFGLWTNLCPSLLVGPWQMKQHICPTTIQLNMQKKCVGKESREMLLKLREQP